MADHTTKRIEDIVAGDFVMSYDIVDFSDIANKEAALSTEFVSIENNRFVQGKVVATRKGSESGYYFINNRMKATFEHPIFVKIDNIWRFIETRNLKVGYKMLNNQNEEVEITSIEKVNTEVFTANLTIENYATFIAESFVVHNIGESGNPSGSPNTTISDGKDPVGPVSPLTGGGGTGGSSIGGLTGDI